MTLPAVNVKNFLSICILCNFCGCDDSMDLNSCCQVILIQKLKWIILNLLANKKKRCKATANKVLCPLFDLLETDKAHYRVKGLKNRPECFALNITSKSGEDYKFNPLPWQFHFCYLSLAF